MKTSSPIRFAGAVAASLAFLAVADAQVATPSTPTGGAVGGAATTPANVPDGIVFYNGRPYLIRGGRATVIDATLVPNGQILTNDGRFVPLPAAYSGFNQTTPAGQTMQPGQTTQQGTSTQQGLPTQQPGQTTQPVTPGAVQPGTQPMQPGTQQPVQPGTNPGTGATTGGSPGNGTGTGGRGGTGGATGGGGTGSGGTGGGGRAGTSGR